MKLEHFGMAEPGDCRLVFTAGAEELAAAVAQVQAEPDAAQAFFDFATSTAASDLIANAGAVPVAQ